MYTLSFELQNVGTGSEEQICILLLVITLVFA
jgi:hypothetical protein